MKTPAWYISLKGGWDQNGDYQTVEGGQGWEYSNLFSYSDLPKGGVSLLFSLNGVPCIQPPSLIGK